MRTLFLPLGLVTVAGALALASSACGLSCTLSLHDCSLLLTVEGLEPGLYDVSLSLDGRQVSCKAAVPIPARGSAGTEGVGCGGDVQISGESRAVDVLDPLDLPGLDGGFRLRIPAGEEPGPSRVSIAVRLDGDSVLERTVTPSYTVDEPNGPGCGECARASDTLRP